MDRFGVTTPFVAMGCLWLFDTGNVVAGVRETHDDSPAASPADAAED